MPTIDVAMPLALLLVVTVAFLLYKRTEKKLKSSVEESEFQTKDVFMIAGAITIVISTIILTSHYNPGNMFGNILLSIFLGSYTMLLFTFSYLFSGIKKRNAILLSIGFGVTSLLAGLCSLLEPFQDPVTIFRAGAFLVLTVICFTIAFYEHRQAYTKKAKWYLAIHPPALFMLIFIFFNILHFEGTLNIWFPTLLDIFGATFAILIILYLSSLFNWKTVVIFAALLTLIDIILVFSGPMGAAADTFTGLGLPALIYLPKIPLMPANPMHFNILGFVPSGLGLGDFFFAGTLAIQTLNRFNKKYAYASILSRGISFGIWEAFLPEITAFFNIYGFPATVCIITGWLPIAVIGTLLHKKQKETPPSTTTQTQPLDASNISLDEAC
jgi:MFS family permease